jgi:hypothetical protein
MTKLLWIVALGWSSIAVSSDRAIGNSPLSSVANRPTPNSRVSPTPKKTPTPQFRCDGRTHCSQMTSCEEATFFLRNCPGVKMDGDMDGIPCEQQWCNRGTKGSSRPDCSDSEIPRPIASQTLDNG